MPSRTTPPVLPADVQMQRIVSLAQAAELSGLSIDTLKRQYAERIISLSPRRKGMRISDALLLTVGA